MKTALTRREVLALGAAALMFPAVGSPQAPERKKVTIAVGGKNLLYYLPLTIAEQKKYFEAEGLDVTIVDFAGGARALQAVVGGSADVVSGAFEHNINMQAKGQPMRAFVLQGREPTDRAGGQYQDDAELQDHRRFEGQEDRRQRRGLMHKYHG